jgi:hypothetical protein
METNKKTQKYPTIQCANFWFDDPKILLKDARDFYPFSQQARKCTSTALNSLTRFGIYLAVILTLLHQDMKYLVIGAAFAIISLAIYFGMKEKGILREGFEEPNSLQFSMPGVVPPVLIAGPAASDQVLSDVIGDNKRTVPTEANPFMNVLVNEYKDNPSRGAALSGPDVEKRWSDVFQTRMYNDPTDVFQHSQNQRTWTPMPSTTIPNDQHSFQNWLFRIPGQSCKEGNNRACKPATQGATVTWINSDVEY